MPAAATWGAFHKDRYISRLTAFAWKEFINIPATTNHLFLLGIAISSYIQCFTYKKHRDLTLCNAFFKVFVGETTPSWISAELQQGVGKQGLYHRTVCDGSTQEMHVVQDEMS